MVISLFKKQCGRQDQWFDSRLRECQRYRPDCDTICNFESQGWKLVVTGHSLGAGVAALLSLKLQHVFPGEDPRPRRPTRTRPPARLFFGRRSAPFETLHPWRRVKLSTCSCVAVRREAIHVGPPMHCFKTG